MSTTSGTATLPPLAGQQARPVRLSVDVRYQFCVDAGASAAVAFFSDDMAIGLHDHISYALQEFMRSVRSALALTPDAPNGIPQGCADAFAAGYLGRVQQELRLFGNRDMRRYSQHAH